MELTTEEVRVLGSLVEKHLTTPQLYPLTENALIAACNQSTNRDPVVSYDQTAVRLAVRSLRQQGLVRTVHRPGERSEKHQHQLESAFSLSRPELAVLAVLMLRGAQTPGEVRIRTERMHHFASVEEVQEVLDALGSRAEALVVRLERQPGQKEVRYGHLLNAEGAQHAPAPPHTGDESPTGPRLTLGGLADEVATLRSEVAALRAEVAALRAGAAVGRPEAGPEWRSPHPPPPLIDDLP